MARRLIDPPPVIVQRLNEAFNKQDADAVAALLAVNCVVAAFNGGTEVVGAPAIQARYLELFEARPRPRLSVTGRLAQGDTVVQQEAISSGLTVLERRIAIYTVQHEKVVRVDLVR